MKKGHAHRLDIPPFTGRILSDYDKPSIVDALVDCEEQLEGARILEESRNRVGVITILVKGRGALQFVIKEFRTKGIDKWKSLILPSKARKAWNGSLALIERNLLTPMPVAYLERRAFFVLKQCYFITEYVPGIEEVRHLFRDLSHEVLRPLLSDLARYLARCADCGILHRDLSDGNVLVEQKENGPFRFFLLDTNRIRCKNRIGPFKRIKGLIRLGVPQKLQRFFLEEYFLHSPFNRVHWLWYRLSKDCFTGYIWLKKLLRLKKLTQLLKIQ